MAKQVEQKSEPGGEPKQRVTDYRTQTQIDKIKFIVFMDDNVESQTSFVSDAIDEAIAKWEKKNGEAKKK